MIKIKSAQQAKQLRGVIPEIVIALMNQFEGDDQIYDPDIFGYMIWLEKGDDISNLPEVGANGLLDSLKDVWTMFEHVDLYREGERRIYSMVITIDADKTIIIFTEDTPWLDKRLRAVFEQEVESDEN